MDTRTITCKDCGTEVTYPRRSGPPKTRCEDCVKAYNAARQKRWRKANPDRAREHWNRHSRKRLADPEYLEWKRNAERERKYGLTSEDYEALLADQDNKCAICGNGHCGPGENLHVDHDHETGVVRGLLCGKCNTLIGLADEEVVRLSAAIDYLQGVRRSN